MNWDQVVERVSPHLFKIETPQGYGTGFVTHLSHHKALCGVATAAHVVDHADKWQEPIKLTHQRSDEASFLDKSNRVVFSDLESDSAVILFVLPKPELFHKESCIPLLPVERPLSVGTEVAWLGFPAVAPDTVCFFSGNISARRVFTGNDYLIDGVAISGVSGGPVLFLDPTEGVQIVGTITAYAANRATGEALPGLSVARDVTHFHSVVRHINSFEEANRKKAEIEQGQKSDGG